MSKIGTFFSLVKQRDMRGIVTAVFTNMVHTGLFDRMPDDRFLKKTYRIRFGKRLNLDNPTTYNEKLQWLKLNDRNPLYTELVDKYAVKDWVAKRIGSGHVAQSFGMWRSVDDINFDTLPNSFVLKTNHDSGGVVVCRDKKAFDIQDAKKILAKHLNNDFYRYYREWPYKNVSRCVFAEEYLEDADVGELPDYKFFCFNGVAKVMFVATERFSTEETKFDFFDMEFNHLPIKNGHPNSSKPITKPAAFDEMRRYAEELSKDIPHVRVDFYIADDNVYFGEMTFTHWAGLVPFDPEEWDYVFGSWIDLPKAVEGHGYDNN